MRCANCGDLLMAPVPETGFPSDYCSLACEHAIPDLDAFIAGKRAMLSAMESMTEGMDPFEAAEFERGWNMAEDESPIGFRFS